MKKKLYLDMIGGKDMKKQKKVLITPDKSTIYYEVSGNGFPLFLLHGNGGSGRYFDQQIPEFSQSFKVFTIDSRGHGHSTNQAKQLSFSQMADDLYLIMVHEGIHHADILGFSDGANLAMVFTKRYPTFVHRLVLNAGNTTVDGVFFPIQLLTWLEYFLLKCGSLFSKRAQHQASIVRLMLTDIGVTKEDLHQIKAKTLVIVGKYDLIKQSHSIYLAKEIPDAVFVLIPKQGHSFAKKVPRIFNEEILAFLKEKKV